MAIRKISVAGLNELLTCMESLKASETAGRLFVLFCGATDPNTGHSWCSDCVKADPIIDKVASEQKEGVLVTCTVGDRPTWKDTNNSFRTNPKLRLTGVPTLMEWDTVRRLGPEQCADEGLVRMVFEEED